MIGFTVVRGNDQGIPARVSAMTIEYGSPPIARRGERFFAPTHDRGAVLESMKNQQEEDCACGRVRRAHHVFPRHRMRNRRPSLTRACREHKGNVPRRTILLGAHGAPYRRWSRIAGFAAYLHADFAHMGCPAAVRLVPQHFEERRVGSSLLPFGDGVWWAGGGRQGRVRAVVPADQSLAGGSAPFSTRFASKAAEGLFAQNKHAGRGGRPLPSRHSRPDLSRQADNR